MQTLWSRISHLFGHCPHCVDYSTDEGIGGKCVDCGKVWGWVTRDELRAYSERMARKDAEAIASDWNAVAGDLRTAMEKFRRKNDERQ